MFSRILKRILLVLYVISLFVFASYLLAQVNPADPVTTPEPLSTTGMTFEAYGVIQTATAIAFSINGQIINIADNTIIQVDMDSEETVRVRGTITLDGAFEATSVEPVTPNTIPGIVILTGSVTILNPSEGHFELDNALLFTFNTPFLLDGIQVGDMVRVFAFSIAPNQWNALGVNRLNAPNVTSPDATVQAPAATLDLLPPAATAEISEDFEIVGVIEQLGDGFVVINGQRINTTRARIEDALAVGLFVEADVYFVGSELFAEEIKADD
jgi:hypothetical protein